MVKLYLIAMFGFQATKPYQTLVQTTGTCSKLNHIYTFVVDVYTFEVA